MSFLQLQYVARSDPTELDDEKRGSSSARHNELRSVDILSVTTRVRGIPIYAAMPIGTGDEVRDHKSLVVHHSPSQQSGFIDALIAEFQSACDVVRCCRIVTDRVLLVSVAKA